MKKLRLVVAVPLFAIVLLGNGQAENRNPLVDFEVLSIPRSSEEYSPGRRWIDRVGPDGPINGTVESHSGLSNLEVSTRNSVTSGIEQSLVQILSPWLSVDVQHFKRISVEDLVHRKVYEIRDTRVAGRLIWETIEGTNIRIEFDNQIDSGYELSLADALLQKMSIDGLRINGTIDHSNEVELTSSEPLVFAVRVVDLQYEIAEETITLSYDGTSESELGYRIVQLGAVDLVNHSARVRVDNPGSIGSTGHQVELSAREGWANPDNIVVTRRRNGRTPAFVWDVLFLQLTDPFTIRVVRQAGYVSPSSSGF